MTSRTRDPVLNNSVVGRSFDVEKDSWKLFWRWELDHIYRWCPRQLSYCPARCLTHLLLISYWIENFSSIKLRTVSSQPSRPARQTRLSRQKWGNIEIGILIVCTRKFWHFWKCFQLDVSWRRVSRLCKPLQPWLPLPLGCPQMLLDYYTGITAVWWLGEAFILAMYRELQFYLRY